VQAFMKKACGVVLSDEQSYLLDARLGPVARDRGFPTILEFVNAAVAVPGGPNGLALVDAMTTHETFFFRDLGFWKAFEEIVLPKLFASSGPRPLSVWSAACSFGQEAYSLAMLLEEKYPTIAAATRILGTDVSPASVERARDGTYSTIEVNRGLNAARMVRHFEQGRGGLRAKAHLRQRVQWHVHNLLQAPPGSRFDVVLCRNVLIYFNDVDRKTVLAQLATATAPGGFIGVGSTELMPLQSVSPGWYAK
jgi:chemotaxis protein methyltransferase CheR